MASLFLFALILGGGLLGLSLLADLFGGGGVDFDGDLDGDLGVEGGLDAEAADLDGGAAPGAAVGGSGAGAAADLAGAFRIFTLRNLTYFLFGFGGVGWLLLLVEPGLGSGVVTLAALLGGGLSAGAATLLFGWVRVTASGWQEEESSWVGCEGRVVLPMGHGKLGQIIVTRGDREHELRALPFHSRAEAPERWRQVVVIEMDGGTARVSPLEALAPALDGPAES